MPLKGWSNKGVTPKKARWADASAGARCTKLTCCGRHWAPISSRSTRNITPTADRKSTRLNSSHLVISYAVFCLKKKKTKLVEYYFSHSLQRTMILERVMHVTA